MLLPIRKLSPEMPPPYDLLLLADPSMEMIATYLPAAEVYVALHAERAVGCYVLLPLEKATFEIKNIAVAEAQQGKGLGSHLLQHAIRQAQRQGAHQLQVGTANSSFGPLYLYQKHGFRITAIKADYFTQHYPEPMWENGLRVRDLLVLRMELEA